MRSWQASRQIEFYGNNPSWKRSEKNGKERAIIELRARTIQREGGGECNSGTCSSPRNSFLEISLEGPVYIRIPSLSCVRV